VIGLREHNFVFVFYFIYHSSSLRHLWFRVIIFFILLFFFNFLLFRHGEEKCKWKKRCGERWKYEVYKK
jgi:hypothetical protein